MWGEGASDLWGHLDEGSDAQDREPLDTGSALVRDELERLDGELVDGAVLVRSSY
jgi:hypothetical protein